MDFRLNRHQEDIKKAVRDFAGGEFDPDSCARFDRECVYPSHILKKASALGFIGMHVPEEYGGQGLGYMENVLAWETFCRMDSGIGAAVSLYDSGSDLVNRYGGEEQKKGYLTPLCSGNSTISPAFLENDQKDVPFTFHTRALKEGDNFRINGSKTSVKDFKLPGTFLLVCSYEDNSPVFFLAEKNECDERIVPDLFETVGMKMVSIGDMKINDLTLSKGRLLGGIDDGHKKLSQLIKEMNLKASAIGTGIGQGAFDLALSYADRREQFGRKISTFDAIKGRLADMAVNIEFSRLLTYRAAWDYDSNNTSLLPFYMSKSVSSGASLEVSRDALHIFGGYGYITDYRIERFYRDACMVDLIGLPAEINEKLLAEGVKKETGQ